MGMREQIVKAILAKGGRTDLVTPGYHGTTNTFRGFENQPMSKSHMVDRALGTHVAADPALASSFPDRAIKDDMLKYGQDLQIRGEPQVLPVVIPAENKFLQADQPRYARAKATDPEWQSVLTDQGAIQHMAMLKAYQQNPELLERYLMEARAMPAKDAISTARALHRGDTVRSEGLDMDMARFVKNYGGTPYNISDKQAAVDLAREAWEKEGYKGIRYTNTAPMEAGAPGVKDPTSYIVFRPENIRSRFAKFDPANADSSDLLASITALGAVPATLGAFTSQDDYEVAR
jgi:hypothetical protein